MRFALLLAAFAVSAAVACSSSSTSVTANDDAGVTPTSDAGGNDASPSDAGTSIVPKDATKMVVTEKGGFTQQAPDGSTCQPVDHEYTLVFATRELSWKLCESDDAGIYTLRTGQKTLSTTELATVQAAIDKLARVTQTGCGADKPADQIVFTTPGGDVTLDDPFYFCDPKDTKTYASGIGDVLVALDALAK